MELQRRMIRDHGVVAEFAREDEGIDDGLLRGNAQRDGGIQPATDAQCSAGIDLPCEEIKRATNRALTHVPAERAAR